MSAHQPIVGDGAFAHESGIHTAGLAVHPSTYEFIPKKMVGAQRRLVFGKHSGSQAVAEVLSRHKRDLGRPGSEDTRQLSKTLRDWAKRERETRRREISESELLKMAAQFQQPEP
jgi:isopropylmalate/homocitrate/citramalate synthase